MKPESHFNATIYDEFKDKDGSDSIASAYAISGLSHYLRKYRPRRVLEVGAGIGTTTLTLIRTLDAVHADGYKLVSIEPNDYCISQFKKNLGVDHAKAIVARRYEDIPQDVPPFDFVLIDGGGSYWQDRPEKGAPVIEQNCLYVSQLERNATIFVENDRAAQRALFLHEIKEPIVYRHSMPIDGGTGYHLYKLNPHFSERLWFRARHHINRMFVRPNERR